MAFDFKKEYKEFYLPKNRPEIITVPPANYLAVRGQGDPNEAGGAYQRAIGVLYTVAYTLKMSYKTDHRIEGFFDYVVPPLEGFWEQDGTAGIDYGNKAAFRWISVIRLPDFITEADFRWAVETASAKKKLDCSPAEFLTVDEGLFDFDIDFRGVMEEMLKKRRRLDVVRLQFSSRPGDRLSAFLCKKLKVGDDCFSIQSIPLDFSFGFALPSTLDPRKEQKNWYYREAKPFVPVDFARGDAGGAINYLKNHDMLLSFPFQSTKPFVDLLYEAGDDPSVLSIKISLYRLANHSKIASALAHAAEKGKDVLCVLELRARFDEQSNIDYATMLEEAGCTVIYGLSDYKIHAKLCLITRKEHNQIHYITQVGTGNYNEKTSEQYTDLSFISSDPLMGEDATRVFQALCVGEVVDSTQSLWVAPNCFEQNVLRYIQEQIDACRAGKEGYIFIKVNSLNDMEVMEKLIEASQAGVKVEMVIRGICCLCPGIEGYTDNIRIKSIVGRYLEHSRIFIFGTGDDRRIFMGSGDLLNRNTRRRVEVFAEVKSAAARQDILHLVEAIRMDNQNSWEMLPDGSYYRATDEHKEPLDSHTYLHEYFERPLELPPKKASLRERLFGHFHKK